MDEAIKLLIEQLSRQMVAISTTINGMDAKLNTFCEKVVEHGQRIKAVEDKGSCIEEKLKQITKLEAEFNEHKLHNGYTQEKINGMNQDLKPIRDIKSGVAILLAITIIISGITGYFRLRNEIRNYNQSTAEASK